MLMKPSNHGRDARILQKAKMIADESSFFCIRTLIIRSFWPDLRVSNWVTLSRDKSVFDPTVSFCVTPRTFARGSILIAFQLPHQSLRIIQIVLYGSKTRLQS